MLLLRQFLHWFTGITSQHFYCVTLRLKRPIVGACIGAAIGGLFVGAFSTKMFCDYHFLLF